MIRTDKLLLKPPPPLLTYAHWFTDQTVTDHNSHGKLTNKVPGELDPSTSVVWGVFVEKDRHIGNVALMDIDWIARKAEFSCIFGNPDFWGNGNATEAIKLLFDHGFEKLNLNRIWLGTPVTNLAMKVIAEQKLFMKFEGALHQDMFLSGEYVDVLRYGITRDQWRNR